MVNRKLHQFSQINCFSHRWHGLSQIFLCLAVLSLSYLFIFSQMARSITDFYSSSVFYELIIFFLKDGTDCHRFFSSGVFYELIIYFSQMARSITDFYSSSVFYELIIFFSQMARSITDFFLAVFSLSY